MLSVQSTRVVMLHSPTQIRLLSETSKSTQPIHEKLLYANFVLLSPIGDTLIWGGGEKNGNGGIVMHGDRTTIIRRASAKPMLCRVLVSDEEEDSFEVWCVWSDNMLSRSRYNADSPPEVISWKRTPRLVIICGSDPCLAVYHLSQNIVNGTEGKTLLAVAAASAITSVVSSFARRWLMDSPNDDDHNNGNGTDDKVKEDEEEEEDRTIIYPKARFDDSQREMIALVSGKHLCAASDGLGRIFVFRPLTLHILRILKGYRNPSLIFQSIKRNKSENEWIDMLLVLAPLSRGNKIEVWRPFGGDSDTPFAFAKLPSQVKEARLVNDSRGQKCAVVTENEFLTLVELDLDANELDWDEIYGMIRSSLLSTSSSLDIASIEFPLGMFLRAESVLRRFATIESSAKRQLGVDFYLRFLQLQKQEFDSKNLDSQLVSKRIDILQAYRKLAEKLSKPMAINNDEEEKDENSPRRWAMELTSSHFKSPTSLSSFDGMRGGTDGQTCVATLILQPDNPNPYFDILLSGDVFVVRELEMNLKRIGHGIEQKYVHWFVSNPVEWMSSTWRNKSAVGSNVLIKMALALGIQPQHVLDTCPTGRVELARSAMLCRGMSRAQVLTNQQHRRQEQDIDKDENVSKTDQPAKQKEEVELTTKEEEDEWNLLGERLKRAFRIAVLLDNDEMNLNKCMDEAFVVNIASESCVPYHQTGRMVQVLNSRGSSTVDNNKEEEELTKRPWERPSHPLDELKEIYSTSIFGNAEKRDQFRLVVARKALTLGDYSMAMVSVREVETGSTLLTLVPDALNLLGDVPPCPPQLARLLMFLLKDRPAERDAVNALAMASEIRADAIYGKVRGIMLSTALKGSSSSTKNEEETLLGTMAVRLFREKLTLENSQKEDDEVLRVQGKSIGLKGEDEPSRYLSIWHYLAARDARGNQCFDNIVNDSARTLAAGEALKICRMRLSEFLRAARGNAHHAAILASLPPKTTSWLMATSTASEEMIKPAKSSLRSTLSVLLKIEPHLPSEKPKDAASHTVVTPQERCVQLITLVESFLSTVNND